MHLGIFENAGNLGAARIGDQRHPVAALFQLSRQRMRGDHVAAGTAGSEDEMLGDAHPPAPFMI